MSSADVGLPGFCLKTNVIVKSSLPPHGILCSNPQRARRLASHMVTQRLHTDSWGVTIWVGSLKVDAEGAGISAFVAALPMGAGGAAHGITEILAAIPRDQTPYLVRYGSNDRPIPNDADSLSTCLIVCEADNLYGLMRDLHFPPEQWGSRIPGSSLLMGIMKKSAQSLSMKVRIAVCHHVEDYHSLAFDIGLPETARKLQAERVRSLEARDEELAHTWDMETAALYLKARQFGCHSITVLQNVYKHGGKDGESPYEGTSGEKAKELEPQFLRMIVRALWMTREFECGLAD